MVPIKVTAPFAIARKHAAGQSYTVHYRSRGRTIDGTASVSAATATFRRATEDGFIGTCSRVSNIGGTSDTTTITVTRP